MPRSRTLAGTLAAALAWAVVPGASAADLFLPVEAPAVADDPCEGQGAGSVGCTLSLLQRRRGRRLQVVQHPGVTISSDFSEGIGSSASCDVQDIGTSAPYASLYNAFGAGGGGEAWHYRGMIIGAAPREAEATTLTLLLKVSASSANWALQAATINVVGLKEGLPKTGLWSKAMSGGCPPDYCLVHMPSTQKLGEQQLSSPPCGLYASADSVSAPAPKPGQTSNLEFDVTPLMKGGFTTFQVWAAPSELYNGMWQTSTFNITSWGYSWTQ